MANDSISVLIIDDSPADRTYYKYLLERVGPSTYRFIEASTGEEGLEVCRTNPPDCILLDYHLPDLNGLEFLEGLGEHAWGVRIPVIMLTGHGNESVAVAALKQGAADYLVKGELDSHILSRTINHLLDRRKVEEALRQRDLEYRLVTDNVPALIASFDSQQRHRFVNKSYEEWFGEPREQIVGKHLAEVLGAETYAHIRSFIEQAVSGERVEFEALIPYSGGKRRWVQATYVPDVRGVGGEHGFYSLLKDIDQRKRAEQQLRQQTEELIQSNAELERFAYIASHDLQEPLRMVGSYVRLLERRYKDKLDADAKEFIYYAVDGAIRMQHLIEDLLRFSRIGSKPEPFTPTNCNEVLRYALENLKVRIEETGANVTYDPLPMVLGDPGQLTQVFQNLISNAMKFKTGETPHIHLWARRLGDQEGEFDRPGHAKHSDDSEVPSSDDNREPRSQGHEDSPQESTDDQDAVPRRWQFSVRDNGIGLDQKFADKIFMIFQRLHGPKEYSGTGIGLAVCKKIVERHGGRIWVESEPGKGCTFHFTIAGTTE